MKNSCRIYPGLFISTLFINSSLTVDMRDIELKATHVSGNIFMLEGVGGFAASIYRCNFYQIFSSDNYHENKS